MKNTIQYGCIFLSALFIYSCAGTRKVDFDSAYKFNTYRYKKVAIDEVTETDASEAQKLSASISQEDPVNQRSSLKTFEESLAKRIGFDAEASNEIKKEQIREEISSMGARERRKLRKEVRAELKKLRMEADLKLDIQQDEQVSQMSDATRLSIVAGSVGLVLLILGAIFSVSFLTIVGAIITVGAAILFIIDQV